MIRYNLEVRIDYIEVGKGEFSFVYAIWQDGQCMKQDIYSGEYVYEDLEEFRRLLEEWYGLNCVLKDY